MAAISEPKVRNRHDDKWAHPEIAGSNLHTMPFDNNGAPKAMLGFSREETLKRHQEILEWGATAWAVPKEAQGWINEFDEFVYEVPALCPEEPDAPSFPVKVLKPKGAKPRKKYPLLIEIPAGGLIGGGMDMGKTALIGTFRGALDAVILLPQYRYAPTWPYPAALNDLHSLYQWALDNADMLQINTDKIVIHGVSSGGILSLALGFRVKRYDWLGGPKPRGIIIGSPMIDDVAETASSLIDFDDGNGNQGSWSGVVERGHMKLYLQDLYGEPGLSPEAVPSRMTVEDARDYPPTWFVYIPTLDPGCDSAFEIARKLNEADVFCDLHAWGGGAHMGFSLQPDSDDRLALGNRITDIADGAFRDAVTYDLRRTWTK